MVLGEGGVLLGLGLAGDIAACLMPAMRAAKVDPAIAMRPSEISWLR
jgi:ABC-type lipoprotein release transport system permease subunit